MVRGSGRGGQAGEQSLHWGESWGQGASGGRWQGAEAVGEGVRQQLFALILNSKMRDSPLPCYLEKKTSS